MFGLCPYIGTLHIQIAEKSLKCFPDNHYRRDFSILNSIKKLCLGKFFQLKMFEVFSLHASKSRLCENSRGANKV